MSIIITIITSLLVFGLPFLMKKTLLKSDSAHLMVGFIFCIYLIGVLTITLGIRTYDNGVVVNYIPLQSVFKLFSGAKIGYLRSGVPGAISGLQWIDYASISNIVLNILMFVPLGYLLPKVIKRANKRTKILLVGFFLSLMIETTQLLTHRGWFDVDDLIYNTIGAWIGFILHEKVLVE